MKETVKETFVNSIRTDEIYFKCARGNRDVIGKESHPFFELLLLLDNSAIFTSEKIKTAISQNDLVFIPQNHFHQFTLLCDDKDYYRYVLQFYMTKANAEFLESCLPSDISIYKNATSVKLLFDKIDYAYTHFSQEDSVSTLESVLKLILFEIKYTLSAEKFKTDTNPISKIVEFINNNYTKDITVKDVANNFYLSENHISHLFKKNMNISVYQYILQKRLVLAYNMIAMGESATQACYKCGFNDYSGFYKKFRAYFDVSPSDVNNCEIW